MGEIGCLKDGNFQNLQVEGNMTALTNLDVTGNIAVTGDIAVAALAATGNVTVTGGLDVTGTMKALTKLEVTGDLDVTGTLTNSSAGGIVTKSETSGNILPAHTTDNPVPAISQPAGTFIKDVFFLNAGDFVTDGVDGHDFVFTIGTAAAGTQIVAQTGLLDDGGVAVTWTANSPLPVIKDGMGQAADAFATTGIGPKGGPATTEAIVLAAPTYSVAARDIHVNFKTLTGNMTTATTTIKVVIRFMYV